MAKKNTIKDKAYQQALIEFREEHIDELENNMTTFIEIRDNTENSARDRNEAAKNINKMMGSLGSEKIDSGKPRASTKKKEELTPTEKTEVERLLNK